jgi:antitoxin CptB
MTESSEIRLKRLLFRSWHRGTREADLLFGSFAERHLAELTEEQLVAYENLLQEEDPELWDWVVRAVPPPPEHDTVLIPMLRSFRFTARPA